MGCHVAQVFDEPRFGEQGIANGVLESGFVDEGAQVVLVRLLQGLVVGVHPGHGLFQRAPGVEAGHARITVCHLFGLAGGFKKQGPFRVKEGEVAHLQFALEGAVLEG